MTSVAYQIEVRLFGGRDQASVRALIDSVSIHERKAVYLIGDTMLGVHVRDRSAAKDLAWQLLVHPDVHSVQVSDAEFMGSVRGSSG